MVETRLQKSKKLLEMATDYQSGSSHTMKDTTLGFIEKVIEKMEALETSWDKKMDLLAREQETNLKTKEEVELTQHWHIEAFGHRFFKRINKLRVSATKNNVIDIYLHKEEIIVDLANE